MIVFVFMRACGLLCGMSCIQRTITSVRHLCYLVCYQWLIVTGRSPLVSISRNGTFTSRVGASVDLAGRTRKLGSCSKGVKKEGKHR